MSLRIKRGDAGHAQFGKTLTSVLTELGLPEDIHELEQEIDGMVDVLLGRVPSPIESPYLSLQEVATAYHSRAQELDILIHRGEREGRIHRGMAHYKFRTGELRSFIELAKRAAELGSRRLTQETLLNQQRLES